MRVHPVLVVAGFMALVPVACRAAARSAVTRPSFDPPAVRSPSALTADAAEGQVFLEWNPGLEDDLAGYHMYRRAPQGSGFERVTPQLIEGTVFTDSGLTNGVAYDYRVTAVLRNGRESEPSNQITVAPGTVVAPQVAVGATEIRVPGFDAIRVPHALAVLFENGPRRIQYPDWADVAAK